MYLVCSFSFFYLFIYFLPDFSYICFLIKKDERYEFLNFFNLQIYKSMLHYFFYFYFFHFFLCCCCCRSSCCRDDDNLRLSLISVDSSSTSSNMRTSGPLLLALLPLTGGDNSSDPAVRSDAVKLLLRYLLPSFLPLPLMLLLLFWPSALFYPQLETTVPVMDIV